MLSYKLDVRKRLKSFSEQTWSDRLSDFDTASADDDSFPDGCTLESLKCRRMAVAKCMFGHIGQDTNIEAPLFCTVSDFRTIGIHIWAGKSNRSKYLNG